MMSSIGVVSVWWARPALQPLLLAALLSSLLPAWRVDAIGCDFPAFVQTNRTSQRNASSTQHHHHAPRDWSTHVRDQFTEIGRTLIIGGNSIVTRDTSSSPATVVHTRVCIRVVGHEKYLVAHEEPGQQGQRFTCLQFVQRSPEVFQLREASVSQKMDRKLCGDAELRLNQWLVVDRNRLQSRHIGTAVSCPISGGFSMHIFDKGRNEGVCDAYLGETRFESECQPGDGLIFRFRRQTCVPQDMYMHNTQPVVCLITWTESLVGQSGNGRHDLHQFTLLRHAEPQHAYFWLLRTPKAAAEQLSQFTAYLFKDLVADTSNYVNATRNYIRFDAVRDRPRSSSQVCVDEYGVCADHGTSRCIDVGSGTDYRLTCPATCGLCNATRPVVGCRLPPSWIGSWRSMDDSAVTVNETTMMSSSPDNGNWNCIQWEHQSSVAAGPDDDGETMLVADYDNGCRQRFRCARALRRSTALVYLHVSQVDVWPFVRSSRNPLDCGAFRYAIPPISDTLLTTTGDKGESHMVALYSEEDSVDCNIPSGLVEFAVIMPSSDGGSRQNSSCAASLTLASDHDGTEIQLDIRCKNRSDEAMLPLGLLVGQTIFSCLESSTGRSDVSQRQQLLVVTRTVQPTISDITQTLVCWLFPIGDRRGEGGGVSSFQMFVGRQCDAIVLRLSQPSSFPGRPRPSADQTPSTANFVRISRTPSVTQPTLTTRRLSRPGKLSPRPTPPNPRFSSTPSPSFQFDSPGGTTGDGSDFPPNNLLNGTVSVGSSVEESESDSTTSKGVAVAAVIFILAVIQAIAFCRC